MNEEIEAYLRNTPENTNWNVFEGMSGSGSGEETWPKLIHVIYDGGWKMADDSDFSTFAEAYNFIKEKWNVDDTITSDYIILKHVNNVINSDAYVRDDGIEWYVATVPYETIYVLTENSYQTREDS